MRPEPRGAWGLQSQRYLFFSAVYVQKAMASGFGAVAFCFSGTRAAMAAIR